MSHGELVVALRRDEDLAAQLGLSRDLHTDHAALADLDELFRSVDVDGDKMLSRKEWGKFVAGARCSWPCTPSLCSYGLM